METKKYEELINTTLKITPIIRQQHSRAYQEPTLQDAQRSLRAGSGIKGKSEEFGSWYESQLIKWARDRGRIIGNLNFELDGREDAGGFEHHVFFHEETQRWVKITKYDTFKFGQTIHPSIIGWERAAANPLECITRYISSNQILNDTIELHGVYVDFSQHPHIITSQADIQGTPIQEKDLEDMEMAMYEAGFIPVGNDDYYNMEENYYLGDINQENIIITPKGYTIIDAVAALPNLELQEALYQRAEEVKHFIEPKIQPAPLNLNR